MSEARFAEYWAQAEFCYLKAGSAIQPACKQLWIQMAQDWMGMAESLVPQDTRDDDEAPDQAAVRLPAELLPVRLSVSIS